MPGIFNYLMSVKGEISNLNRPCPYGVIGGPVRDYGMLRERSSAISDGV